MAIDLNPEDFKSIAYFYTGRDLESLHKMFPSINRHPCKLKTKHRVINIVKFVL